MVLSLAAAVAAPGTAVTRAAATPASACLVVLECPNGVTQQVAPDATGQFVFKDVPAGSCRVSVVPANPADPAAPVASASSSSSARSSAPSPASSSPSSSPSSSSEGVAVAAPRDAATGMATGKRMHKPLSFSMVLDQESAAAATATADDSSSKSVTVVVRQMAHELRGHVTLMK
jgi:hypothetical protein